jgi:glucokinase
MLSLGIDVGGTTTRAAVVDETGRVCQRQITSTSAEGPIEALIAQWSDLLEDVARSAGLDRSRRTGIGLAVPGLIDRRHGMIRRSVNLPVLSGAPVRELLEERSHTKVTLLTDIEAATLAECRACGAAGEPFVHLRIGTGVGCGVIKDGRFIEPSRSVKGHADVLVIEDGPAARPCTCGRRGCLEAYLSGRALEHRAGESHLPPSPEAARSLWLNEDRPAVEFFRSAVQSLVKALNRIVATFQPKTVCIGGGVIDCWPEILSEAANVMAPSQENVATNVVPARLGDDAGAIGAATAASQ